MPRAVARAAQTILIVMLINSSSSMATSLRQDPTSAHLADHTKVLRVGVRQRISVENKAYALLDKWTQQAKRIAKEADQILELSMRPKCAKRIVSHLEDNLHSLDRGVEGIERTATKAREMNDETSQILGKLSKLISARSMEINTCMDRCGPSDGTEFESDGFDCEEGERKFRTQLERSAQSNRKRIKELVEQVNDRNIAASSTMSGSFADSDRKAASERSESLNSYLAVKHEHENLSKHLRQLLAERADSLGAARLARNHSNQAISSLRAKCEKESVRQAKELNISKRGAQTMLSGVKETISSLNESVGKIVLLNDQEEKYAMQLAAQVDKAAADCVHKLGSFMTTLQNSVSNFHAGSKEEEAKTKDHVKRAVSSFFRGGSAGTKSSDDKNMLDWAAKTISTDRERSLNGGSKASKIPVTSSLVSISESNDDDTEKLAKLRSEAAVVNDKLRRAEKSGRVGKKLPQSLVANVEQTSEELWDDLSKLSDNDLQDASSEDEEGLSEVVQDTTQLDDDLVNPAREDKVPIEYAKLAEELGEAKAEGDI